MTSPGAPVVSVVMPVFDTPRQWLEAAVRSVAQHSSRYPFELIICDDGTSRRGRAVIDNVIARWGGNEAATIPITLLEHKRRRGPAAARNTAAKAAKGQYLLWLDSDDELLAGAVDALVARAIETRAAMVVGRCRVEESTGTVDRDSHRYLALAREHRGTKDDPLAQVIFAVQPQLVDAEAFRDVGGFDADYALAEVSEFFLRFVGRKGLEALATCDHLAYLCHRRRGSLSNQRKELMAYRRRALRAYCKHYVSGVTIDDLGYRERSSLTGAQHFTVLTTNGTILPAWEQEFLPPTGAPAEESPAFVSRAQALASWARPALARAKPAVQSVGRAVETGLVAAAASAYAISPTPGGASGSGNPAR